MCMHCQFCKFHLPLGLCTITMHTFATQRNRIQLRMFGDSIMPNTPVNIDNFNYECQETENAEVCSICLEHLSVPLLCVQTNCGHYMHCACYEDAQGLLRWNVGTRGVLLHRPVSATRWSVDSQEAIEMEIDTTVEDDCRNLDTMVIDSDANIQMDVDGSGAEAILREIEAFLEDKRTCKATVFVEWCEQIATVQDWS